MTTPGTLTDGRQIGYGLGLFLSEVDGRAEILHGGDFGSFTSLLARYPADDVTVAVLQNSGAMPAFDGHLARRLVRRLLRLPEPQRSEMLADETAFNRVIGSYRIGASSIDVRRDASNLVLSSRDVWQLTERIFAHREAVSLHRFEIPRCASSSAQAATTRRRCR